MAKPQQPELRRSGTVPALDPDATEAVLSAQEDPKVSRSRGPIPDEQRPGHHPDEEQDKPDLASFAERLGIPAEGDEPDEEVRVEDEPVVTTGRPPSFVSSLPLPVKLMLVGPALTFVGARGAYRTVTRVVCQREH